jgi:hypothetical protein
MVGIVSGMRCGIFIFLLLASAVFGSGLEFHAPTEELLKQNPLCLTASGRAELSFEKTCAILVRDDLLAAVQRSYAAGLPEGEPPEFTVEQLAPGMYHYTNRLGQETMIEEVSVTLDAGKKITLALYSEGRRFFGNYQSLCQVEVVPCGPDQVAYTVTVYARPESAAARFFSRVTPVKTYFRHKMKEMTGLVVEVCDRIPTDESKGGNHVVVSF